MNCRERFQAVTRFQPFDRLPLIEWAMWWDQTIDRWHTEGLSPEISDRYDLYRHFGQDMYYQDWFPTRRMGCPDAPTHGAGIITDLDDYERIKPFLYPDEVIDEARWGRWAAEQARGEAVLWFTVEGFFWFPRTLLGIERHLYAPYDQPELLHRINSDLCDWILKTVDKLTRICTPDFMTFGEDMSYNHGPMLSKSQFDIFLKPYYQRVLPELKRHGILTIIDSDGDVTIPSHWFEAAGLDGILPLERQAGVDIDRLRTEHPRMNFIGHYDKMTMNQGEAVMRAEFERLLPAASRGGFLISVDHQTPPGVSYQQYLTFLTLYREYAQRAGELSQACLP